MTGIRSWPYQTGVTRTQCVTTPRARVERSKSLVPAYLTSNVLQNEDSISRTVGLLGWMDEYAEEHEPTYLSDYSSFYNARQRRRDSVSKSYGFTEQGIRIQGAIARNGKLSIYASYAGYFEGGPSTTRDIQAQAKVTAAAGGDTVSTALRSFVYHMIRLPGGWEKARAEIDAARVEPASMATGAMGLSRVVTKYGISLGGLSFQRGTSLSISIPVIHHSKEIRGPDANVTNPDRRLSQNSGDLEKFYIPSGTGYNTFQTARRRGGEPDLPLPLALEDKTSNLAGSPEDARRGFNSWDSWEWQGPAKILQERVEEAADPEGIVTPGDADPSARLVGCVGTPIWRRTRVYWA
ncbi:hypothetical protein DL771_003728 [Monosporascus sp. 5C6A]|nr:hypothetical protein DL771_003728 [Monosporascus sp. 5C6A]